MLDLRVAGVPLFDGVGNARRRREQALCVGVRRRAEHLGCVTALAEDAVLEHQHLVGDGARRLPGRA